MVYRIWDMRVNKLSSEVFPDEDSARANVLLMISLGAKERDLIIIPTLN